MSRSGESVGMDGRTGCWGVYGRTGRGMGWRRETNSRRQSARREEGMNQLSEKRMSMERAVKTVSPKRESWRRILSCWSVRAGWYGKALMMVIG